MPTPARRPPPGHDGRDVGGPGGSGSCGVNQQGAWRLVFRQTKGAALEKSSWQSVNPTDPKHSTQFSTLSSLEKYRGPSGGFEFKLEWPADTGRNYQRWRQTSNPVTQPTSAPVTGFEAVDVHTLHGAARFGGLKRTSKKEVLLVGADDGSLWHAAPCPC